MRTELISIATDTTPLDGAFYEPEGGAIAGAVLLFHGNTMNFYVGASRFLPPVLTRLGYACLAFNRRGHDILGIRNSRAAEGAAFQLTREGIADNRIAAEWLAARGFPHPAVIGHSNGGMLGVRHVADHPQTPALVCCPPAAAVEPRFSTAARPACSLATGLKRLRLGQARWSRPGVDASLC